MGKTYLSLLSLQQVGRGQPDWDFISDELSNELVRLMPTLSTTFSSYNRIRARNPMFKNYFGPADSLMEELEHG